MKAHLRWFLLIAIASAFLLTARGQEPDCCSVENMRLSRSKTKALVQKMEPILPPPADGLRLKGFVSLRIAVDQEGAPICIRVISGHPLMFGATIESVRHWRFRPLTIRGVKKEFCGRITIKFEASDYAVKYKLD